MIFDYNKSNLVILISTKGSKTGRWAFCSAAMKIFLDKKELPDWSLQFSKMDRKVEWLLSSFHHSDKNYATFTMAWRFLKIALERWFDESNIYIITDNKYLFQFISWEVWVWYSSEVYLDIILSFLRKKYVVFDVAHIDIRPWLITDNIGRNYESIVTGSKLQYKQSILHRFFKT